MTLGQFNAPKWANPSRIMRATSIRRDIQRANRWYWTIQIKQHPSISLTHFHFYGSLALGQMDQQYSSIRLTYIGSVAFTNNHRASASNIRWVNRWHWFSCVYQLNCIPQQGKLSFKLVVGNKWTEKHLTWHHCVNPQQIVSIQIKSSCLQSFVDTDNQRPIR